MKYSGKYPVVIRKIDNGDKLGAKAETLAYPTNTAKADYPNGKPTDAFKKAMDSVYRGFKFWNAWSRVGASCDVFVGTCVRSSGLDPDFPAGLWKQQRWMEQRLQKVKEPLQDGDIIIYKKDMAGRHGHICIHYKGKVKEASAKHYYGKTTNNLANRLNPKGKKYVYIYRFKDTVINAPIKKGSKGEQVERLQRYMNWYFANDINKGKMKSLKVDGDFLKLTLARVKLMQKSLGVKVDGVVGSKTLQAMKGADR